MSKTEACINWIKDYFKDNSEGKAIIGISGGKDSTIAAALCVEALGADRVIGVLMPNSKQSDIGDSFDVCKFLGIHYLVIDIGNAYSVISEDIAREVLRGQATAFNKIKGNKMYAIKINQTLTREPKMHNGENSK